MQPDDLYNQQAAGVIRQDNGGKRLKMSKKPVLITLAVVAVLVAGLSVLISFLTHPKISLEDSDRSSVDLISSKDVDNLDMAVGDLLGVLIEEGAFETTCTEIKGIDNCGEIFGQGAIYGLAYDHKFLSDKAYAFVRLGSDKEAVYNTRNYENFSLYRIDFSRDGDKYVYAEMEKITD